MFVASPVIMNHNHYMPGRILLFFIGTCLWATSQSQTSPSKPIPKDWFEKDPATDSVAGISLAKAYQLLEGRKSTTVIVAVIDNGIDLDHEDLKNEIWTNQKEIPGNGIDDDHNGYVDDVHGWNFRGASDGTIIENEQSGSLQFYLRWRSQLEDADTTVLPPAERRKYRVYLKARADYLAGLHNKDSAASAFAFNVHYHSSALIAGDADIPGNKYYGSPLMKLSTNLSHGTHVAGIIAAQRNNDAGINGIADNVLIMPIVATTATGDERDKDIANAICYAVDNGAKIINMSFSKWYSPDKDLVDKAVSYAETKNVLIIHAAGNDGVDIDSAGNYHYPIAIDESGHKAGNFITVGWSRPLFDYRLAHPYSDYGKANVDVFAPGSDIYSTVPHNAYDYKSGSSMSAPVVAGVAALLWSYFPSLPATKVKEILLKSSYKPRQMVNQPQTKLQVPFESLSVSGGIVNAYNAVKMAIEWTKIHEK